MGRANHPLALWNSLKIPEKSNPGSRDSLTSSGLEGAVWFRSYHPGKASLAIIALLAGSMLYDWTLSSTLSLKFPCPPTQILASACLPQVGLLLEEEFILKALQARSKNKRKKKRRKEMNSWKILNTIHSTKHCQWQFEGSIAVVLPKVDTSVMPYVYTGLSFKFNAWKNQKGCEVEYEWHNFSLLG